MIGLALLLQAAAPPPASPRPVPCFRSEVRDTATVSIYLGDRTCLDFAEPREMEGIWLDQFEGQDFMEGARSIADRETAARLPWFNTSEPLTPISFPPGFRRNGYGHAYRVRFIGRSAVPRPARDDMFPNGFGHLGVSPGLVLVDEMLAIEDLGPIT